MIESIFSSKLFRSSRRKSDIISAVSNPLNQELVEQLSEYVDPVYLKPKEDDTEYIDNDNKDDQHTDGEGNLDQEDAEPSNSTSESDSVTYTDSQPDASNESSQASDKEDDMEDDDELDNVNTSTNVSASTVVDIVKSLGSIKELLNSREALKGVYRTNIKDHEFWIYYSGDVNLNNVMSNVIDLLNASCYSYLEFNRLSRSDNAVIFEIDYPEFLSDNLQSIGGNSNGETD